MIYQTWYPNASPVFKEPLAYLFAVNPMIEGSSMETHLRRQLSWSTHSYSWIVFSFGNSYKETEEKGKDSTLAMSLTSQVTLPHPVF
jgi:hypothetical protein